MSIAERILYLFELNNEIPTHVLPKLGLSKSSMSDWKRGKSLPSSDAIIKLASHFNVTTDYLLLGSSNATIDPSMEKLSLLLKKLPREKRSECLTYIKGYIQAYYDNNKSSDRKKNET